MNTGRSSNLRQYLPRKADIETEDKNDTETFYKQRSVSVIDGKRYDSVFDLTTAYFEGANVPIDC